VEQGGGRTRIGQYVSADAARCQAPSFPNAGLIVEDPRHDNLFTVVHDLIMTGTARHAGLVLPTTSQIEHVDLHKVYGHRSLQYNHAAIAPLGESKSNGTC